MEVNNIAWYLLQLKLLFKEQLQELFKAVNPNYTRQAIKEKNMCWTPAVDLA